MFSISASGTTNLQHLSDSCFRRQLLSIDLVDKTLTCGDMGLSVCFIFPELLASCFPNEPAADIALNTVKTWIEQNSDKSEVFYKTLGAACFFPRSAALWMPRKMGRANDTAMQDYFAADVLCLRLLLASR
ncbi:hypothetical protein WMY93_018754 [Mugilogobius chulae]|uniref:Uncharacterized protein n=1 Tax=Mugilogobius chulae TaxID=88201 RepID=A0AAW0NJR8_9GOBI